jgi:hypothetical protein
MIEDNLSKKNDKRFRTKRIIKGKRIIKENNNNLI